METPIVYTLYVSEFQGMTRTIQSNKLLIPLVLCLQIQSCDDDSTIIINNNYRSINSYEQMLKRK